MSNFSISGQVVDVLKKEIFPGTVEVENGKIKSITKTDAAPSHFILPGFVDAHVHVESSMLIPSEFARLAVPHGTVATISDPHEIGNVLGIDGVKYMINNGKKVPFKFAFGAPSCVPATAFETAGAVIDVDGIDELLQMDEIVYLAEMMNFPGVLFNDPDVMAKIALAKKYNKPVDGHAPGVRGDDAKKYIEAGIYTDHECFTKEEALDKLKHNMKIMIREGSAAKNYDALISLLDEQPDMIMFCSDDKHPNELAVGHLNQIAARSVAYGADLWNILRALTYNVVSHYNLNVGLVQQGDPADFIIAEDLKDFNIKATYIDGELVAENGKTLIKSVSEDSPNNFNCQPITVDQLVLKPEGNTIRVIEALDGQLITNEIHATAKTADGNVISDVENDILKMVVYNRYNPAPPAIAFVKNIGLKVGALASSVAHDSHNIVAVGTNDEDLAKAINLLVEAKGGVSIANGNEEGVLSLPVAGIMTTEDGYKTADAYEALDKRTKEMGATLTAPYMTLSFLALLVIPDLKLSDKGLFSGNKFEFTSNFVD